MWDPKGQVAVVTGGASGIGLALCRALAAAGATVVVADRQGAADAAAEVGGKGVHCDVTVEADVVSLVDGTIDVHGRVDLFCANAGIFFGEPVDDPLATVGAEATDEAWDLMWRVNTLSHVFAARALLPHWLERGEGRLLVTASAAGLLTTVGNAPYTVTKHGAVAFAEWLSITYGDRGVTVTCLCPEGVRTPMLDALPGNFLEPGALDADVVAGAALDGVREGRFLVMPHPHTAEYVARKAADHERWLAGMRKLQRSLQR
jgi:NAD(P)-dependent dehydrogenase (short-subunit alcohol dehydrogenase family)